MLGGVPACSRAAGTCIRSGNKGGRNAKIMTNAESVTPIATSEPS